MKFNELSDIMQKPEPKPDTYEAGMALNQLLKIGTHAIKLHNMIDDAAEMEAWVAKKIDLASNYVKSVHGYTAGSKAGTYDDDGMSEMKKMPKGTGTMQGVKEDTGEQALANELSTYYQDAADGMDPEDRGNDEHDDYEDIAQGFKKGLQAGMDQVNMAGWEFSTNDFDMNRDGKGEVHYQMANILKKYGVSSGINKKSEAYLIKDGKAITDPGHWNTSESAVQEDAGEEQASQKLAQHFQKRANEYKASGDTSDEYEEMQDIADAFRTKGIQAGIDEINSSYFEFSSDPFGRQEQELEPADKDVVDLLKQAGYTYKIVKDPNVSHHTFKRKVVLQKIGKEVSEDAGEGHMSKSQLYQTAKMAIELLDMIKKGDDLEGWVQTKLNLAADYLQAVYHYEDYQKLNPYREEIDSALVQKHAGIIQKHLDEILSRETGTADVDTKPGMMRILAKRVNEVEKEIAKENRKASEQTTEAIELEEGLKDWAKKLAAAGVIVGAVAGMGSINNAIDNSVPAVKALNTAYELAVDQGHIDLANDIKKDLSAVKIRLQSGKDLNFVKDIQNKYSKFVDAGGLPYESKLAVRLNQQLK